MNGFFELSIAYPASTDDEHLVAYTIFDTNNIAIASFSATQSSIAPNNFTSGTPGLHGYITGFQSGVTIGGIFKIKGRAISFPNGNYALYSCLTWFGNGTYCDPNVAVGIQSHLSITQLQNPPKTRAELPEQIAGLNWPKFNQLKPVPKTRAQAAAEIIANTPKPIKGNNGEMPVFVGGNTLQDLSGIVITPPPKAHECANVKVIALKGNGASITNNTPFSCSFSISNVATGQWVVRAEITEKNASAVAFSSGGTNIFTIGNSGKMNGKVTFNSLSQNWDLSQTP